MQSNHGFVVCFDIGGVLVQINHGWWEAAAAAGVRVTNGRGELLNSAPCFVRYQNGEISDAAYLAELAFWLGCTENDALRTHRAILGRDYPKALQLVNDIKFMGSFTCCFSNTNSLHWMILCDSELHPAVNALDRKFASHEIGLSKPDESAFRAVEAQLPAHRQVVFFDDSAPNVIAAADCGWNAHLIDPFADPAAQMRAVLLGLGIVDSAEPRLCALQGSSE